MCHADPQIAPGGWARLDDRGGGLPVELELVEWVFEPVVGRGMSTGW